MRTPVSLLRVLPLLLCCSAGAHAEIYAIDYIASASSGIAMSRSGDVVVGYTTLPPTCTGCTPTYNVPAIWAPGHRQLLSVPTGASYLSFAGVNAAGWIAGTAMRVDATGGAGYVWIPRADGSAHDAQALGTINGYKDAMPAGIDDQNRVYGLLRTWMVGQDPFFWSTATGMKSLTALGYPADAPVSVSPAGYIATPTLSYRYGNPGSVTAVATPPVGYQGNTSTLTGAINDSGMRASFLLSTSGGSSAYRYLARYSDSAGWQVLGGPVSGSASFGVGSVMADGTLTATLNSTGYRAPGPSGAMQNLAAQVSPAYGAVSVSSGGDMADDGRILAAVTVGRSQRLARLLPVKACTGSCMKVSTLVMSGRMVSELGKPGQCTSKAYNQVTTTLTIVDGSGAAISGATIKGRLLDDYYTDLPLTLTTNAAGQASYSYKGPACVGAVAFLVDNASKPGYVLDKTVGQLSQYLIPQPKFAGRLN